MSDLHCHACGSAWPLEQYVALEADRQAIGYLLTLAIPVADSVMQYIMLHTPAKQRLTLRKKIALITQLQPDLTRQVITHKGRDWPAPHAAWQEAIAQMLRQRNDGTLETPLTGHGYLYAVLAGIAAKPPQRTAPGPAAPRQDTVTVRGQTMTIGDAVQTLYGSKDPALIDMERRSREAAQPTAAVREQIARITGKTKPTP